MAVASIGRAFRLVPGIALSAAAAALSWGIATGVPTISLLTACLVLGVVFAQLPGTQSIVRGSFGPGLLFTASTLLRAGIVLLGFRLSLSDLQTIGWKPFSAAITVAVVAFAGTYILAKVLRVPGRGPLVLASSVAVGGRETAGELAGIVRVKPRLRSHLADVAMLVGLIAVIALPYLRIPLGLDAADFSVLAGIGLVGAGPVVATAQVTGLTWLAPAAALVLVRTLLFVPVCVAAGLSARARGDAAARPAVPYAFLITSVGFAAAAACSVLLPVPDVLRDIAGILSAALIGAGLFAWGAEANLKRLFQGDARSLAVAFIGAVLLAALALGAVALL